MKRLAACAAVLLLGAACWGAHGIFGEVSYEPIPCGGKTPFAWWLERHAALVAEARKGQAEIVFLGDSLTDFWSKEGKTVWEKEYAPLKAANFGIGGDQTQYVLYRLTHGELEGLKPKLVVLEIGTNNMVKGYTPEETAAGVKAIVDLLREKLPETKVLVLGLFPQGATAQDKGRVRMEQVNDLIAKLDDGKMVHYLSINAKLVDAQGNLLKDLRTDGAHLSGKGYQVWADAMRDILTKLLAK